MNLQPPIGSIFDMAKKPGPGASRDQMVRVARSADYLADNLEKVPVLIIPCIPGRIEQLAPAGNIALASVYGSVLPATWSYMLAARNRGLGTCWTTVHLMHEQEAADILDIPYAEVYGTASFYKAFKLEPRGKHIIQVCTGTACHVRGAPRIREKLERRLGICAGETTKDKAFTLETVSCLGACALGPVVVVDGVYHGNMTAAKIDEVLDALDTSDEKEAG